MKKEDYFGKYILREGDLLPEEINDQSYSHYKMTLEALDYYNSKGLLFDNKQETMMHYRCIMGAMKKPVDDRVFHILPVWKRAFSAAFDFGKMPDEDHYYIIKEEGILIKVPKDGSNVMFLALEELNKLPIEKGL